jgi:teichuronic acid biosynthesis glycosyltransferase TuaH
MGSVAVPGLDGERSDLVVFFASAWFDGAASTDWHIAHRLGRYAPVLYVEPSISMLTRLNRPDLAGLRSVPPVHVVNPRLARAVIQVIPGMSRPVLHYAVGPMVARSTRRAVNRLYGRPSGSDDRVAAVLTTRSEPLWTTVVARRKVFYATDDLAAGAALLGMNGNTILRKELQTLRGADAVAVVSPALRDRFAELGFVAEIVPNGCDPQAYRHVDDAPKPSDVDVPGPVAGLIGHINDRIDLALLEALADRGVTLLIVGPLASGFQGVDRFAGLAARPTVHWVGPKPVKEMPSYLRLIDVGLTPYVDNAFNRASFPLKTLEYLAAGRAAVSTPLPANDWLDTKLIVQASGVPAFANAVQAALAARRTPADEDERRAFAARHSWASRADAIAHLAGLAPVPEAAE